MAKGTGKVASATKGKAATRKPRAAKVVVPQVVNTAALKGLTVAQLLALRAAMPRANLKGHYNVRRALRGAGYFISQNR